jgi:DNA repair exonuclease SbcCD ATPase subunit
VILSNFDSALINLTKEISQREFRKTQLDNGISEYEKEMKRLAMEVNDLTVARQVILQAAQMTLSNVKDFVEGMVTEALKVFEGRDYKFVTDIVVKGARTECNLLVQEGDQEPYVPKDDTGGGLLDVTSYALRIVLYKMENPKKRPIMLLDEPGKWTGALIGKFGSMIKEISSKLGIQIIMATHDEELMDIGDRVWFIQYDEKSIVEQIDPLNIPAKMEAPRRLNRRKQNEGK